MQGVRKESTVKGLKVYLHKLEEKIEGISSKKRVLEKELETLLIKSNGVKKAIDSFENRESILTTHFFVRYRERVEQDVTDEEIRRKVLTPLFQKVIHTLGNGQYPYERDYTIIVQDNKLITITANNPNKYENYTVKKKAFSPKKKRKS